MVSRQIYNEERRIAEKIYVANKVIHKHYNTGTTVFITSSVLIIVHFEYDEFYIHLSPLHSLKQSSSCVSIKFPVPYNCCQIVHRGIHWNIMNKTKSFYYVHYCSHTHMLRAERTSGILNWYINWVASDVVCYITVELNLSNRHQYEWYALSVCSTCILSVLSI